MKQLPHIPATLQSINRRKPIFGIGINDSNYITHLTINNERVRCPYYMKWSSMIMRCYGKIFLLNNPTYIGCTVYPEWLTFSNFRKWMVKQDWQGKELDKDIIKQGNKVYAPEYCSFISPALNSLLTGSSASRGPLPLGVYWNKKDNAYIAKLNISGKSKHLGNFKTVEEAKSTYDKAKYAEIHCHAMMQDDPLIKSGLLDWVIS